MGALNVMGALPLSLQIPSSPPPPWWLAREVITTHQFSSPPDYEYDQSNLSEKFSAKDENETISASSSLGDLHCIADEELVKLRKRPTRLVLPKHCPVTEFSAPKLKVENVEFKIENTNYCLVSKKGRRSNMEDRYTVITDVSGDPHQAFFAVIDGHGGEAAAEYVAQNLGKNIMKAVEKTDYNDNDNVVEQAICGGYLQTDREFLSQGIGSGACAASVVLRNGELHAANVGDCRIVLSRNGLATRLTNDHRLTRQDERSRIQNAGGFVHNFNGVWRVQGSLAVSRAIGDMHLKDWIISEPEIQKLHLTSDCDFLIMASDGLWDKVGEQEAVDIVSKEEVGMMETCKTLVDISYNRGNRDDITVIVIHLPNFLATAASTTANSSP